MGLISPTQKEYEILICSSREFAVILPFVDVSSHGWVPIVSNCHSNVDRWVAENPGCRAVRGWICYISFGLCGERLTGHSVVRTSDGSLIDITPVPPGAQRAELFIEHRGNLSLFFAMSRHDIDCPNLHLGFDADACQLATEYSNEFDLIESDENSALADSSIQPYLITDWGL